jgi:hypothetical protein
VQHHRLYFTIPAAEALPGVMAIIRKYCHEYKQISVQVNREGQVRYEYALSFRKNFTTDRLMDDLKAVEGIRQMKIIMSEFVNEQ